jgi:Flp pilus assembly protein TadG
MRIRRSIKVDQQGAAALEAAIALPVLITMIYGIFTIGQLFEANAGIQHALGEGARFANLCPSLSTVNSTTSCALPSSTAIIAQVKGKLFGTANGTFDTPTVDTSTAESGYITLTVNYHQTMQFAFFTGPTINVTRSKRVYLADVPTMDSATCANPPSGTTAPPSCSIYL